MKFAAFFAFGLIVPDETSVVSKPILLRPNKGGFPAKRVQPIRIKPYEHRRELVRLVGCPFCRKDVMLYRQTERWDEQPGGYVHSGYGPAWAQCCGLYFRMTDQQQLFVSPLKPEPEACMSLSKI